MKKKLLIFFSLVLFFITLEFSSWLLLKNNFTKSDQGPDYKIKKWEDFDKEIKTHPEYAPRAQIYRAFRQRHPEIEFEPPLDLALRSEMPKYSPEGELTGKYLFYLRMIAPMVDDFYSLKGAISGKTKYRVRYVTNKYGRRDPLTHIKKHPKKNLIFTGCSFTWGEGVQQEKIFSSLVNERLADVQTHNSAIPGYAPSSLLHTMKHPEYYSLDGIDASLPTTVVFVFLNDHMKRIVGTSEYLSRSHYPYDHEPYFYLDGEQLRFDEYFSADFWNFRWAFRLFGNSKFAKVTRIEIPFIGDHQMKLTAKIFEELKLDFKKRFPLLKDFIVVTFPGEDLYADRLGNVLNNKGISFISFSETFMIALLKGHQSLLYDGHPSALTHELFADLLESELKNRL